MSKYPEEVIEQATELIEKYYPFTNRHLFTLNTAKEVFTIEQIIRMDEYKRAIKIAIVSCEFAMKTTPKFGFFDEYGKLEKIKAYLEELL